MFFKLVLPEGQGLPVFVHVGPALLQIADERFQFGLVEYIAGAAEIGSLGAALCGPYTMHRPRGSVVGKGAGVALVPVLPKHARRNRPALSEEQEVPVFSLRWKTKRR